MDTENVVPAASAANTEIVANDDFATLQASLAEAATKVATQVEAVARGLGRCIEDADNQAHVGAHFESSARMVSRSLGASMEQLAILAGRAEAIGDIESHAAQESRGRRVAGQAERAAERDVLTLEVYRVHDRLRAALRALENGVDHNVAACCQVVIASLLAAVVDLGMLGGRADTRQWVEEHAIDAAIAAWRANGGAR